VQSSEFAISLNILPALVPANSSLPYLSIVKDPILPSRATSLSSDHRVSLPVNFLTLPSPEEMNKFLPDSFKLSTPLLVTGIAALKMPP